MSQAEFKAKFELLASVNFCQERMNSILNTLDTLEQAKNCEALFNQLMAP
jgi:hypothetical protein